MKTPAIIGITSIVINAILAAFLMAPFGNLGISLATSIVSLYNFFMLFIYLKKKIHYRLTGKTLRDIIKSLLAGFVLLILLFMCKYFMDGKVYVSLLTGILLTITVYGVVFKNYYLLYLKQKG
jgi:peptidoglycan biosynthesis protein MviN/MurJ (putative lipid II flippase)